MTARFRGRADMWGGAGWPLPGRPLEVLPDPLTYPPSAFSTGLLTGLSTGLWASLRTGLWEGGLFGSSSGPSDEMAGPLSAGPVAPAPAKAAAATSTEATTENTEGDWTRAGVQTSPVLPGLSVLSGGPAGDTLTGGAGDDTIEGLGGRDVIAGGLGQDRLFGSAARVPAADAGGADLGDLLFGGAGDDWLDGGAGNDMLRGDAGDDSLWGGAGADTLIGGAGADALSGGAMGDALFGGAGADFLNGGFGNDRLNGGTGADRFHHAGAAGHGTDWVQDYAAAEGDVLQFGLPFGGTGRLEDFVVRYGETPGAGDPDLAEAFVIHRPTGQILWALVDGQGQSAIRLRLGEIDGDIAPGNMTLVGGEGVDSFLGGPGVDVVNFQQEGGPLGVTVNLGDTDRTLAGQDLRAHSATDTHGNTGERILGIETVHGTRQDDVLLGSDRDRLETFYTYGGRNLLDGGDGHSRFFLRGDIDGTVVRVGTSYLDRRDVISFGFGDNRIPTLGDVTIEGHGTLASRFQHHLVFESLHSGVTVNLGATVGAALPFATGARWDGGSVDFTGHAYFLEVEGSQFADVLIGGNPTHDYLEWFHGNAGADTIHGGSGEDDTVIYEFEPTEDRSRGITVHLDDDGASTGLEDAALERAYGFAVTANGYAIDRAGDRDTLINIDDVRATSGDDLLVGSAGDNGFWGMEGDDTLDGGGGTDAAHYRSDLFFVEVGDPALVRSGIVVDLVAGWAYEDGYGGTDRLLSIENIFASEYGDLVQGNAAANRLRGYAGDDTLTGGWGNDTLIGDAGDDRLSGEGNDDVLIGLAGNDVLSGGAGRDTFDFDLGMGQDVVTDFDLAEDRLRITSALAGGQGGAAIAAAAQVQAEGLMIRFGGEASLLLSGLGAQDQAGLALQIEIL